MRKPSYDIICENITGIGPSSNELSSVINYYLQITIYLMFTN